jgi:mRNA interferase MazF
MVKRGEVWLCALDPTRGSEIQKTRPCVVISPPEIHDYLRTAIVAPLTTSSRPAPYRIACDFEGKQGLVLIDQIRTVGKGRLVKRLGMLDDAVVSKILATLRDAFSE